MIGAFRWYSAKKMKRPKQCSPPTPGNNSYTWTVRADMDANLRKILTDAFLALNKNVGQDKAILELQRVGRFIPANVENPPVMEAAARRAAP